MNNDPVNILLVDDQPAKLLSYEVILRDLGEYIIKATSAREALELLLKRDVAVILIDVVMPETDGFELAAMIREHPRFRQTAIIFVSALHISDGDRLRGYELGAVDYVPVPIIPEVLRAKVRVFTDLYRKSRRLEELSKRDRSSETAPSPRFESRRQKLRPLLNIPSPYAFSVLSNGTIAVASAPANRAEFPRPTSEIDHANRLEACRVLANDLLFALKKQQYNARPEYSTALTKYLRRLPRGTDDGNIMLADAEARRLRSLFAAEARELQIGLSSQLKIFLEQHIGLRVFYPGLASFYRDVQAGRIDDPLPLDATEGVFHGVATHTPAIFDPSVRDAIELGATPAIAATIPETTPSPANEAHPVPPKDPLGELDPQRAHDFTTAGLVNNLWKAFLEGEKVAKAGKAWASAGEALWPYVARILEWLQNFHHPTGSP
jgi:CheY-like chemotaxis protein